MKLHLSQIPEKDRQLYIREEAIRNVYNKMNDKLKYIIKELKGYEER